MSCPHQNRRDREAAISSAGMYEKLRTAIDSGLFNRSLTEVVSPPSAEAIRVRASSLPLPLHPEHVQLLLEWGGSNVDEIRINGLENVNCEAAFVKFANDYNGFIYKYDRTGAVFSEDTDGGLIEKVAESISEGTLSSSLVHLHLHGCFHRLEREGCL